MKKNSLSIFNQGQSQCQRYINNEASKTVAQKVFPSGMRVAIAVEVPNTVRKADRRQCLQELQSLGLNQSVSAFFTDMSHSYVNKLLKK